MVITLSEDERAELVRRAALSDRRAAERARIVLACADGMSNASAGWHVGVQVKTVGKWCRKFAAEGLVGLQDAGRIGRPKADLVLSDAEREQLERWARRAKTAQFLALRAGIVLRCAEGGTNKHAALDMGVDESTVERWRARFIANRLDGLQDEPRPGRPPSILLDRVEDVLVATLESTPGSDTHWSGQRSRRAPAGPVGLGLGVRDCVAVRVWWICDAGGCERATEARAPLFHGPQGSCWPARLMNACDRLPGWGWARAAGGGAGYGSAYRTPTSPAEGPVGGPA
ncbi:hypothetical protein GCM10023205_79620 [Yinghuangia aomiensis]|uniref:Insertion element IS150 protein InsJ-like helix-turn-helix domain-containing protein n=1 Tax=Yinghuangia aomiensis TaxID=676205 RepID=A0ABP9IE45_9ACTN